VRHLLDEHRSARANYGFFLWTLLNLNLWYDHWIEGSASGAEAVKQTAGHEVDVDTQRFPVR